MTRLTSKQLRVLNYLIHFQKTFQYSPTSRELQEHFGWSSQTAAMNYLNTLEAKGYIERSKGKTFGGIIKAKPRTIRVIKHVETATV